MCVRAISSLIQKPEPVRGNTHHRVKVSKVPPEPNRITLTRQSVPLLRGRALWTRTWDEKVDAPEWFPHGLGSARPGLGLGIVDPLELRLSGSKLIAVSAGDGVTLLEDLDSRSTPYKESSARGIIEQLCFGLMRIHQNQGRLHGGVVPFNIQVAEDGRVGLWSVPTARLELSFGTLDPDWEIPYRSPQMLEGRSVSVADDIFSLGKLLLRLFCCGQDEFLNGSGDFPNGSETSPSLHSIYERCVNLDPQQRFQSVVELALALNPESEIGELDLVGASQDRLLGEVAFEEARVEDALAHWTDARRKDWLDLTVHNNLAVARMVRCEWNEALRDLERAHKISPYHPLVDCNTGFCFYRLRDLGTADLWLKRSCKINPGFAAPFKRLSDIALGEGNVEAALHTAMRALKAAPRCREARLLAASVLALLGDKPESGRHRAYALQLPERPEYADHLITRTTPPPWSLALAGQDASIFERLGVSPLGPISAHRYSTNLQLIRGRSLLDSILGTTPEQRSEPPWRVPWLKRTRADKPDGLLAGRIAEYVHSTGGMGALVEIRCESQRLAESEDFGKLLNDVAKHVALMSPTYLSREDIPPEVVAQRIEDERLAAIKEGKPALIAEKLAWGRAERLFQSQCLLDQPYYNDYSKTVESHVKEAKARFGERIAIKRFVRFELGAE